MLKRSRESKSYTLRDVAWDWVRLPPSARSKLLRPQFLRNVPPSRPATSVHSDENESPNLSRLFVTDSIFLGEKSTCSDHSDLAAIRRTSSPEIWLPREKVQRPRRLFATTSSIPECFTWHCSW